MLCLGVAEESLLALMANIVANVVANVVADSQGWPKLSLAIFTKGHY